MEVKAEVGGDGGRRLARQSTSWPLSRHLMRLKQESFPPDSNPTSFIDFVGSIQECTKDGNIKRRESKRSTKKTCKKAN